MKNITINNIDIEVIKKKIKNINLSVHSPDGRVRVSVPNRMSDKVIIAFVSSKISWIEKQKAKLKNKVIQPELNYITGEEHYFQGKKYPLNAYETTGNQGCRVFEEKYIELYVRPNHTVEKREKVMMEWYRGYLKWIVPQYIEKWEPIMGVTVDDFGIKQMKTKWGTCNIQAKRIWINLELAKRNPDCIEFIVVHEMVHLLEKYHNARFYGFMDKFLPDWKISQNELNNIVI